MYLLVSGPIATVPPPLHQRFHSLLPTLAANSIQPLRTLLPLANAHSSGCLARLSCRFVPAKQLLLRKRATMADLDVATRSVTAEKPPSIEPSHTSTAPSTLPSTNPNLGSRSSPPAPSRAAEKMVTSINTTAPTSNASAQHQLNHPALPSPASDEPDVHPSPSLSNTELVGCASPEIDAELAELKPQTKSELPPERLSDHSEKEPEQTTPGKASPSIDERALSPAVANTASESPQQQPRTVATR